MWLLITDKSINQSKLVFFKLLLCRIFFLGFIIIFFSSNLVLLWLGIETISVFAVVFLLIRLFIKDIIRFNTINKRKVIFKYFLIQITRGVVLLFLLILIENIFFSNFIYFLIFFIICVKVRSFPGHSWVIELYGSLSYTEIFIIRVVPKFPALFFLYYILPTTFSYLFLISRAISLLVRVIGRINTSLVRYIMRFSSIINIGWFLVALILRIEIFIYCFIVYILVSFSIYILLIENRVYSFVNFNKNNKSKRIIIVMSILLSSLLGLPLGVFFFFKLYVLINQIGFNIIFIILLLNSLSIYMYIRLAWFNFLSFDLFMFYYRSVGVLVGILRVFYSLFIPIFIILFL